MAKTQKEIEVIAIALNRSWTILPNLNLNQILFDSLFNFHLGTLYFDTMYVTTEAAVYAIAGQRYVTTAGITLLKKSAFARGLVLVPVVVGILHVLLHFEKFQLSRQRHTILRLTKPDFPVHFHLANSVVRIRRFIRASYPFSCK